MTFNVSVQKSKVTSKQKKKQKIILASYGRGFFSVQFFVWELSGHRYINVDGYIALGGFIICKLRSLECYQKVMVVDILANFFTFGQRIVSFQENLCIDDLEVTHSSLFQTRFLVATVLYSWQFSLQEVCHLSGRENRNAQVCCFFGKKNSFLFFITILIFLKINESPNWMAIVRCYRNYKEKMYMNFFKYVIIKMQILPTAQK